MWKQHCQAVAFTQARVEQTHTVSNQPGYGNR